MATKYHLNVLKLFIILLIVGTSGIQAAEGLAPKASKVDRSANEGNAGSKRLDAAELERMVRKPAFLELDLQQSRFFAKRKQTIDRSGNVKLTKDGRFVWRVGQDTYFFDGNTLTMVADGENLAVRYQNVAVDSIAQVVGMIQNPQKLLDRYVLDSVESQNGKTTLLLSPKEKGSIAAIRIVVVEAEHLVQSVKIEGVDNGYTEYKFSNPRDSETITISFSPPPGMPIRDL